MRNVIKAEHYFRFAAIMAMSNEKLLEARAALSNGALYWANQRHILKDINDLAMVIEEMMDRRMSD